MKKIIGILLVAVLVFAMAACASGSNTKDENTGNTQAVNNDVTPTNNGDTDDSLTFEGEVTEESVRNYKVASESEFTTRNDVGGVFIEDYLGNDTVIVIPETIGGELVVGFNAYEFSNDSPVRGVLVPSGVKEITGSFGNNENLEVVIWESAEKIVENLFINCQGLHTVILGDSLTDIGENAFSACKSLEELYIPASVQSLDSELGATIFFWCDNLTITGEAGSFIETFCAEQGIPFKAK